MGEDELKDVHAMTFSAQRLPGYFTFIPFSSVIREMWITNLDQECRIIH